jgi:hypothetical protein
MMRTAFAVLVAVVSLGYTAAPQRAPILRDVKAIQVEKTVVLKPEKVKEDYAPALVESSLRNALRASDFEVVDTAPVRARLELIEFSSGNLAKRIFVGFGAGRSTVEVRLVFVDASDRELASANVKARGKVLFSAYQGANTQRAQAFSDFELRLLEEISRWK